jgi:hypothetical protein
MIERVMSILTLGPRALLRIYVSNFLAKDIIRFYVADFLDETNWDLVGMDGLATRGIPQMRDFVKRVELALRDERYSIPSFTGLGFFRRSFSSQMSLGSREGTIFISIFTVTGVHPSDLDLHDYVSTRCRKS